ncbi:MAG TPA: redox-sensing transcriptional repressor Rex [Acidimicrobiales bacterium]|nr:redox-sensing transcriptional repressor Rex [Acidimicrobiales bacterium]
MPVPPLKAAPGSRLLPEATVKRLPLYMRALADAHNEGQVTISSDELAGRVGANAAQVRKDLSYLGSYGTRGIGYDVESLHQHINRQLGLNREYNVALVGAGNLGQALGHYRGFAERGFHVVAAFDSDPGKVGQRLGTAEVHPLSDLDRVVREKQITMALIATPASVAQEIADRLAKAGVTSVLNFAPTVLSVGSEVFVRKVDLAVELQILGYYEHSRRLEPPAAIDHEGTDGMDENAPRDATGVGAPAGRD